MGYLRAAVAAGLIALAPTARAADVLVFAAASTTDALTEVDRAYEAATGVRVAASFASSGMLARQIENGAPADLFLSANAEWVDYLTDRKLLSPTLRRVQLHNRLALIAPRDSTVRLGIRPGFPLAAALDAAFAGGRLAIGDPRHVPAGRYAKAALVSLGVWRAVEARTAIARNVRDALLLVERGEAPLGIVYATDAEASAKVRVVGIFPASSHPPIVYWTAVVAGRGRPAVLAYYRHLGSDAAAAVFRRHGFFVD